MTCEICGRSNCTRCFHTLREQEEHDSGVSWLRSQLDELAAQRDALLAACKDLMEAICDEETWDTHCDPDTPDSDHDDETCLLCHALPAARAAIAAAEKGATE